MKWTYETGGSTSELPVIDQHGNAYVSVDEGKIIKLNTKGELDWEAIDPNLRTTKPVLSTSGKIFAIRGGAGSLINAEDGTFTNGHIDFEVPVTTHGLIHTEGKIIYTCHQQRIRAFDQITGEAQWNYHWETGGHATLRAMTNGMDTSFQPHGKLHSFNPTL